MTTTRTATNRLCDSCYQVGPLEPSRCVRCGGPTWEIFAAQEALGRAMAHIAPFGGRLYRCGCCRRFYPMPPDTPLPQCCCGAFPRAHPERLS